MKIPLLAKAENVFIGKNQSESRLVMYIDKQRVERTLVDLKIPHKIYIQNPNGKHIFKDIFDKKKVNINIATDFNLNRSNNVIQHCKDEGNKFYSSNYIDQLLIEYDDFFSKYPSSKNPDVLTFDIETYNRGNGSFPKPESEPITILSYKINDEPTQVINLYNQEDQDKLILLEFKKVFEKYDPDVVCGYNSSTFDLVYIIKRCEQYGIDPNFLSRENRKCFTIDNDTKEYKIKLYGRVNFDVYNKVLKDQVIEGVPNKKLKTIANFYGIKTFKFEDIYTKETSLDMLKDQRYIDHVKSDVDATYKLFAIYNEIAIAVCELMHIPYGNYVEGPSSFVPKIFTARNLFKEGYLTFETNIERYKRVAPGAIRKTKDKEEVISNQGAIILMEKFGYFPYTHSVDFKSMYPSCMRTFNLGPDTTKFLRLEPYEESYEPKIQIKQNGDQKWLECIVSDKNFKANVVFAVDLSKIGFLKREMNNFGLLRQEYKKLGKEAKEKGDDLEAKRWKAKDNAIKVIMNSEYGYLSMGYSTWGDLVSAVAITALARWCIMTAITRNRDHICMVHTDSIYADCKLDVKAENDNIARMIKEKTTLDSVVQFEDNGENAAYFIAKGNYALKSLKDGKIILHGGKTKSSKPPLFYNKYVKKFVPLILNEKPKEEQIQVAKELYSMKNLTLEDFLQAIKVTKYSKEINKQENINENETNVYSSDTAQIPMLMMRMYKLFDRVLIPNDTIEYYKVKYDYRLKPEDIDLNEFKKEIQQDNNTIYRILLNYYIDQKDDDELLRQINLLFSDKKLLSSIKVDPDLINNDGYREVYLKEKHGNLGINTVTQLNRLIFDICFPNSIKNKFEFGGYVLAQEISSIKQLDKEYYQDYIVRLLEMFKLDPYTLQQEGYDTSDWGYVKPPKTSRLKKEAEVVNEDKLKAIREKLKLNPKLAINTICS